ncbi:Argininosuccinate synthase [Serratia rubidaea]|uniref:Argininosuccinate synthase n=1 Tax=Serratia rubidaea TaxID=61652 RepID=A0A126VH22_SERRU|nr:carboxymuconolactone decarboxylase family protein [Serratia rubidaea]AML56959.1 4-carboxymuconolactone decarboxylase domain [Serratia rubidaea]MBS0976461.1 carboxymuconolactone decarboxylase family protein [Serratia rubidaea]MCR0997789.1 carboxymuconolactone decarboxylase family protein [Serratia rubidaea]MDC6109299.1 carboxymuconolactone decarboxylase family protein [Serratia rubidaea]QPR64298.1 carboxymuconolactone decarboxylase family protein [Serratia rubidaea]
MSAPKRLPYNTLSPDAYQGLIATKNALENSPLGKALIELVWLRMSQINGCAFCLEMHAKALRADGMAEAKLDGLAGWRVSERFSDRERAALAWTESLTHVDTTHAPDEDFEPLRAHFSEVEISDLTFAIALMSAFNRLAIGMRQ